ncbi:hypothetical protein M501DRAFT_280530 [Patellaria atrata CBS 101060]|uniref:Uncharacterized protein n=1 Tax=Patellaria atrata CBS 101060 TaxID=1346257 RepID=A0A9P4S544_9PEZI|nr:hypothetical protein M501DRAFT_280530 [Patellaria atrata CBS 101060]
MFWIAPEEGILLYYPLLFWHCSVDLLLNLNIRPYATECHRMIQISILSSLEEDLQEIGRVWLFGLRQPYCDI